MALISPQTSFLDSRIFHNYESFTDLNTFKRKFWVDIFEEPRISSFRNPEDEKDKEQLSISPIATWRRAEHTDIPSIKRLCTPETDTIYGTYNIVDLVEASLLPIVLLNYMDEVVAFMAVQDYPHVPFLPMSDWEQWFDEMYQVRNYTALNTRFIHLLVWNDQYEETFFEKILFPVFMDDAYIEYLLLILPYGMEIKRPYKQNFNHYLAIMDLANEKNSVRKIREFKEKHLLGLFVAIRKFVGPNVTIRKAKEADNEVMISHLLKQYPGMKLMFGKSLYLDLLKEPSNKKKKRRILIGEYKDEKSEYGIMTYCEEVNLKVINKNYNTYFYFGFRTTTNIKKFCDSFNKWNRVDPNHPFKRFDRTVRSQTRYIYDQIKPPSDLHSPVSFFPYTNQHFISIEQDETSDEITTLDRGFSVTKMKKDEIYVDVPLPIKEKEDHNKFELKRQICLSYANEENVRKKKDDVDEAIEKLQAIHNKCINKQKKFHHEKESTAIEIEFYVPVKNQEPRLVHNYLKYIFEKTSKNKMYILATVPSHDYFQPLLHYFQLLDRKRRTNNNRDLYVCYRLALTGKFLVKEAEMEDFEEIMALTIRNSHYHSIHQDVFNILRHQTDPLSESVQEKCFVLICCQLLIGFAVVSSEDEVDYLIGNYNLEDFIYYSLHKRDAHGFVRHLVIVPSFIHLTTFFLRSIMRSCFWTSIYAYMVPGHLMPEYPRFSILSGLQYWIPVQPRRLPQYWKDGLGSLTPHGRTIRENAPPFALYHMNYKMSGIQKKLYTFKIVVVGGGELALSFLEHLIFSPTCWFMGYRNITLISDGGIPNRFEEENRKFVKMMMVSSEKYSEDYLNRLSLVTWIDIVEGMVTSIDRKKKFLLVDEQYDFDYDYLFLFCGTQFSKPKPAAELLSSKECRVVIDEIKGLEEAYSDMPINLFTINNDQDAFCALLNLKEILDKRKFGEDHKIVIYGHCLNALACIAALLEYGISGSLISFVEPAVSPCAMIDYAFDPEIYNSIKTTLNCYKINGYYQYSFTCYETEEHSQCERKITKVHFQSHNRVLSLSAIALFSFEPKAVHHRTRLALQKACLVFDGKLVIDSDFLTNDKNIYAGGSLTRYKKKYYCENYNHEYFSPHEIGAEIAYRFQKRVRLEEEGHRYLSKKKSVTELTSPVVVSCRLPGGWNYLHITKPGPLFPIKTIAAYRKPWGKILFTGNPYNSRGPGYFRIITNNSGLVCDILCFTTQNIEVWNFTCLYNKHESLLNKMHLRYEGGLISDFYIYFRENWVYALYHDRFPLFMEEIQTYYLQKLEDENVSFYESVAYAFNVCKWEKISDKDKELLEDLFNFAPELRETIENKVLDYLGYNDNQLTTYLTRNKLELYENMFKESRLLEPADMERGLLPLVPTQPEYIVPTPGNRKDVEDRIMERPMEKLVFKVPRGMDKDDEEKLSAFSSDQSLSHENILYLPEDATKDIPYIDIDVDKLRITKDEPDTL